MKPVRLIAMAVAAGVLASPVLAFQEGAPASTTERPAAVAPGKSADQSKGLSLKVPELSIGKGTGTEVKIPGIGSVGVLPKLDFGLELLYGATEQRGVPEDKSEPPSDVQIRGTIKHRW
jgi:hypothetical protein